MMDKKCSNDVSPKLSERLQQCTTNLTLTYHKYHYIATDVPTIVSATVTQPNFLSTVLTPTRPMRTKPHPTLRAVRCNQVQTSDSFECYARVSHANSSAYVRSHITALGAVWCNLVQTNISNQNRFPILLFGNLRSMLPSHQMGCGGQHENLLFTFEIWYSLSFQIRDLMLALPALNPSDSIIWALTFDEQTSVMPSRVLSKVFIPSLLYKEQSRRRRPT